MFPSSCGDEEDFDDGETFFFFACKHGNWDNVNSMVIEVRVALPCFGTWKSKLKRTKSN